MENGSETLLIFENKSVLGYAQGRIVSQM